MVRIFEQSGTEKLAGKGRASRLSFGVASASLAVSTSMRPNFAAFLNSSGSVRLFQTGCCHSGKSSSAAALAARMVSWMGWMQFFQSAWPAPASGTAAPRSVSPFSSREHRQVVRSAPPPPAAGAQRCRRGRVQAGSISRGRAVRFFAEHGMLFHQPPAPGSRACPRPRFVVCFHCWLRLRVVFSNSVWIRSCSCRHRASAFSRQTSCNRRAVARLRAIVLAAGPARCSAKLVNRQHDHKKTRQHRAGPRMGDGIQAGLPEEERMKR